jgi:Arc/MetJ family transcription regulator
MDMRTNVVLDDELVREAMALSQLKTKRDLVDQALREFVAFRKRLNIRDLRGSGLIDETYDYKALRTND